MNTEINDMDAEDLPKTMESPETAPKTLRGRIYSLLRKSERFTKTDMVYLTKGSFWLFVSQGVSSVGSFLLAIACAHFLPKEVYGDYKYIISISGIITTFTLTGLGTALTQSVARGFDGTFEKAVSVSLKWSVFMVFGSLVGAAYYLFNENYTIGISLIIIACVSPFLKVAGLYGPYLSGKKDFKTSSFYASIESIVATIAFFIAILFTDNVIILVGVFFGSDLITKSFFYFKTRRDVTPNAPTDYSAFSFGKHLSLINIWLNVSAQIDKVIVYHYLGAAELAIYAFSTAIPKQVRAFIGMLAPLAMPKLAERDSEEIKKSVPKKFLISLTVLGPAVIIYILLAPYIYQTFFPQYMEAVFYSQIYATFILLMGNLSEVALTAKQAIKEKYYISIGMSIFNTVLMLVLVHPFGILGVILAIVITKYITTLVSFTLLKNIK